MLSRVMLMIIIIRTIAKSYVIDSHVIYVIDSNVNDFEFSSKQVSSAIQITT